MGVSFTDKDGKKKFAYLGSYGIGLTRAMGTIAEVHHDDKGIIWPANVAPFDAHLITLGNSQLTIDRGKKAYAELEKAGIEVLYDDREDVTAGGKFADADLIGIPVRLIVSEKTGDKVEFKLRSGKDSELLSLDEVIKKVKKES